MGDQVKFVLDETQIPKAWYNLTADLPKPLPPVLHPGTKQPVGPADLEPLFPMALILQEVTAERYIDIPELIRNQDWNYALFNADKSPKEVNQAICLTCHLPVASQGYVFGLKKIREKAGAK